MKNDKNTNTKNVTRNMIDDILILAGGFGARLWPASTAGQPKQFMSVSDNLSFLQMSIKRAFSLKPSGRIIVATRSDLADACAEQCEDFAKNLDEEERVQFLKKICVLAEPKARHTAAAIMLGTYFVQKISGNTTHTVLVLTSDHLIGDEEKFFADCKKAALAAAQKFFVCFSIVPTEPSSEYGYIKTGGVMSDLISDLTDVYRIEHFKEKPDLETAKKYVESGNYWWNSGMFAFDAESMENDMKNLTPEIFDAFSFVRESSAPKARVLCGIEIYDDWEAMTKTYETVPAIAIDKAVAEKTEKACAVRSSFSWTDVGNWDVFAEIVDSSCNTQVAEIKAHGNFVYSDIPVAICGVDDLTVVIKNGKALIMKKGCSSLVREANEKLK